MNLVNESTVRVKQENKVVRSKVKETQAFRGPKSAIILEPLVIPKRKKIMGNRNTFISPNIFNFRT